MTPHQKIDRVRRDYNKWVADQTLEDFALRFTAKTARRFSPARVGQTALGAASFLALEAISGSMTLHFGFTNTIAAIVVATIIIFAAGVPICFYAAEYGVDIDLLTRGAGFGYIGSTITSLIYASFTFILFAIESSILAIALELCLGIPLSIGYLLSALAVIPLVIHGIAGISRFQVWTQPIWIALNIIPVVAIALKSPRALADWHDFAGSESGSSGLQLASFGTAAAIALAFIVQLGEQVDYLRFLPTRTAAGKAWWMTLLAAGPGWVIVGVPKLLVGSFLAVYLVSHGVASTSVDPPHMYAAAFNALTGSPAVALALTCVFVVVCQLKINVTNAYAGSIAWSNFFSRLTHHHPGRVVWLVFNVLLALLVMELGVYNALEQTLAFYSSIAVAWIGAIVADLVVNKPLGLSPPGIEFKRAYLYDINPVGVGAMGIAASFATLGQFGLMGPTVKALAPFFSLAIALVTSPLIAFATGGRFYLARQPEPARPSTPAMRCCVCENPFEPEDMARCPAYAGMICSLCCSLDARCADICKPHARLGDQLEALVSRYIPDVAMAPRIVDIGSVFALSIGLTGMLLSIVGLLMSADPVIPRTAIGSVLWKALLLFAIVAAVVGWLFVLLRTSGRAARSETHRQTRLLLDEIEAHRKTDFELKKAKEAAEAANFAKSRYVVGLSHELRTPLNSIMGYAQLLERDAALPSSSRGRVAVMRRNARHLGSLIDGLLDISKIEAGKLDLARDEIAIRAFLTQLVDMFSVQAESKGIGFVADITPELPEVVAADEKRLRQVLINLLSNAVKFTPSGTVSLKVTYRNEVAQFVIDDTGPGIPAADLDRIFLPFERLRASSAEPGTGLGLTICRLLAGVMGGEIRVTSRVGEGSSFGLRLFLPRTGGRAPAASRGKVAAGFGVGKTILVADDDPTHRAMIAELIAPYGFVIQTAEDGKEALQIAEAIQPDLYLLDIELPGMNGWELAKSIRAAGLHDARIVMLSASAPEEYRSSLAALCHDAFIMKPVDFDLLLETLADLCEPSAPRRAQASESPVPAPRPLVVPEGHILDDLLRDAEIGYVRGLRDRLAALKADASLAPFADQMLSFVENLDMPSLMAALRRMREAAD